MLKKIGWHSERGDGKLRAIDRYLGIPIVLILALFHRKKRNVPNNWQRIALLKTSGIGDTVVLTGVIQDIRNTYPKSEIVLFVGNNNYEIAKLIREIDLVVPLNIKNFKQTFRSVRESGAFDAWIDFGPWPRYNAIISFISKASLKIGFKTKGQFRHYGYDVAIDHVDHVRNYHELENYRKLVAEIGVKGTEIPRIVGQLASQIKDTIILHIKAGGSRSYLKEWPEKYWIETINWLTLQKKIILLTGTIAQKDELENIKKRCQNSETIKVIAGEYDLLETAKLLGRVELVISVDTGIMHMASAVSANLIALHGPSSPGRWGPLNQNSIALWKPCDKSPCVDLGFENSCKNNNCMQSILPKDVIDAMLMMFQDGGIDFVDSR